MEHEEIKRILELHTRAVERAKEAYKEAEDDCRENTFMDSGESESYIKYVEGIEAVMEILGISVPDWDLEDDDEDGEENEEDEEELTDEDYEDQFGSEMAVRICQANNIPLSQIEEYGSDAYWINDALNNLQDLDDINKNFVLPTKDKSLIRDYKKEFLRG